MYKHLFLLGQGVSTYNQIIPVYLDHPQTDSYIFSFEIRVLHVFQELMVKSNVKEVTRSGP